MIYIVKHGGKYHIVEKDSVKKGDQIALSTNNSELASRVLFNLTGKKNEKTI